MGSTSNTATVRQHPWTALLSISACHGLLCTMVVREPEVCEINDLEPIKLEWTPKKASVGEAPQLSSRPRPRTPDFLISVWFQIPGQQEAPKQQEPPPRQRKEDASASASQSNCQEEREQRWRQEAQRAKEEDRRQRLIAEVTRISRIDSSNFIRLLELNMHYNPKELEQKKRALVLLLHPDKASNLAKEDAALEAQARHAYDAVCNAYEAAKQQLLRQSPAPASSGPHAGTPRAQPPPSQSWRYRCAHLGCSYFVTIGEFGGFCCKKCHAAFLRGSASQHGSRCHRRIAENSIPRADPVAPEHPLL